MDSRLLWLALGAFAGSVESSVIVSFLPDIATETGSSVAQAGLMVFAYSLAYGFGTPLFSTLFGRHHRRRVVVGAELVFGLGAILMALAPGLPMLIAARTLLAVGAGLFTSTAQAAAVGMARPGERGRALAIVVMGGSVAVAFGSPLGALVGHLTSWRVTYFAIGVLAILAAITMLRRLPDTIVGDGRSLGERLAVVKEPGVPMVLLSSLVGVMGLFVFMIYLAPIVTVALGLDAGVMPLVLLMFGLGAIAGGYFGGRLCDRIGAGPTQLLVMGTGIIELALTPLIAGLPQGLVLPVFLVHVALFGVVTWAFFPPQLIRLAALSPGSAVLVASLNLTAMNLGGALAALVGGAVLERLGPMWLGPVAAAIAAASLLLIWLGPKEPGR
ncbi:MFS transporter [Devosia sp.]|uniref:MFS transporter n=1 Tax=Devosia sp. TaxID=1871048 RepID=UPI003BA86428